jgi:type IV fimbrial biogenesis protein FimT
MLDDARDGLLMRCRGISIIETLIVIAIMGLLLAAAMPTAAEYMNNARIRGVAEEIRDGINRARMEAIRRNATVNFVPDGTGWSVVVPATGQTPAITLARRTPYDAEAMVTAQPSAELIGFGGSGRLTSAGPFTVDVTATGGTCAASGGGARCLRITAVRGGNVRMCDPAQASSKPEGC